jgi:hypothetical protein
MPTRRLPPILNIQHLKHQARDLLRHHRAGRPDAFRRIREFHPRFGTATDAAMGPASLPLADAHLTIAREHGFRSWARLRSHVGQPGRSTPDLSAHERIDDPAFRRAVDLLCDSGADPDGGVLPALVHGEFEAAEALIRRGAKLDLTTAAATGRFEQASLALHDSGQEARHRALALAALHGRADIVRLLLDAGEDPNRYNPVGCHAQQNTI